MAHAGLKASVPLAGGTFSIAPTTPSLADLAAADAAEAERRHDPAALRRQLEAAERIDQIIAVIKVATEMVDALKATNAGPVEINEAAELVLRGERRGAEMVAAMIEAGEIGSGKGRKTFATLGVDKKLRERFKRLAAIDEEAFERQLARAAAAAAGVKSHVPFSAIKMTITKWRVDPEDGLLTRRIFQGDADDELPTKPKAETPKPIIKQESTAKPTPADIVGLIVPPGSRAGADRVARERQRALFEWLRDRDCVAIADLATTVHIEVPAYTPMMASVYRQRVLHRDVAKLEKLGLVVTKLGKWRGKHARMVRRAAG